ncbi:GH3 auxin-responsive promoter-binding protein [Clostridium bovifaecis]|uniref:GH3 auxin-responsive promoter-binding protein n=1 Tax=Clostridium bovifaecis TaxID=2184719 RepID=A0A6I6ENY1_9CLOT|nr:GH3 auxin-responsive promoter-binding protein [Clostridium bovifaecis]
MNMMQSLVNLSFTQISKRYYNKFQRDLKKAGEINRDILREILSANKDSEYGRKYNFKNVNGIEDYKRLVPITDYSDYEKYIERSAKGEKNILTSDSVEFFALSSGTTGSQKLIPVTSASRANLNGYMNFLNQGLIYNAIPEAKKGGRGLFLMSMPKSTMITPGGIPAGAGTSEGIKAAKRILPYMWVSPIEVLEISKQETANYLHALFALKDSDLSYIASPFPSNIVQVFGVIEENWEQLVLDIAVGTISKKLDLEPNTRFILERKLKPNVKRATELEKEFSKGMEGVVSRIWPKINYVSCVAGGAFSIYVKKLRYFIGNLPIFSSVYAASEALIGMAVKPDDATYVVTPRTAYFEFIPLYKTDSQNPDTLCLDELKIGESYEIIITNFSGLYRYRIGDVVKVVDYYGKSPVIEFLYRKGQLLNLVAEKTTESAVHHSIMASAEKWDVELVDYTAIQDLSETVGCYKFYVEVNNPGEFIQKIEMNRAILEEAIREANPTYKVAQRAGRIAPLKLEAVAAETFLKLKNELVKKGASINQVKVPRVINGESLISILDEGSEDLRKACKRQLSIA